MLRRTLCCRRRQVRRPRASLQTTAATQAACACVFHEGNQGKVQEQQLQEQLVSRKCCRWRLHSFKVAFSHTKKCVMSSADRASTVTHPGNRARVLSEGKEHLLPRSCCESRGVPAHVPSCHAASPLMSPLVCRCSREDCVTRTSCSRAVSPVDW